VRREASGAVASSWSCRSTARAALHNFTRRINPVYQRLRDCKHERSEEKV
jgi:hypothetical protein